MPPEVQQPKSSVHIGALLITLLLLGVAIFFSLHAQKSPTMPVSTITNNLHQIPGEKIPPDMPTDIVLAKDAKIVSSYTATIPGGQTQSTIIYSTSETQTSVIGDYIKFLGKNGWSMILPGSALSVRFKQGSEELSVSTSQKATLTLVSINLLTNAQ